MFSLLGLVRRFQKSYDFETRKRRKFVNSIAEGWISGSAYAKTLENMMNKCLLAKGIEEMIQNAQNDLEQIAIVQNIFQDKKFEQVLKGLAKDFEKSEEISNLFIVKAKVMMDMEYELILRCINLAILFAPMDGGCLGEKYALRARIFYIKKKPENCIKDIALALSPGHGCSDETLQLLLGMKIQCMSWNKKKTSAKVNTVKFRSYRDNVIFQLSGEKNEKIPAAIHGLRVNFNETKERHVLTDRHIAPGTPVIVEEPYAKMVADIIKWDTRFCFTCLAKVEQGIPCPNCVFVTYCSEECLRKDLEEGHVYECPILPLFQALNLKIQFMLAFKIICKQGPKNLYNCWIEEKSNEASASGNDLISGFNPKTGIYDSDSYYQIHRLKAHFDENEICKITWYAVSTIKALDYLTPFFKDYDQPEFKTYVASLFVKNSLSLFCNAVGLFAEVNTIDAEGNRHSEKAEIAAAVYSFISLLSHSCDPNVMRLNLPNGKMAVITNRALNPGDEILFSYGYSYLANNLVQRQTGMQKNYHFPCKCIPCTLNWPILEEFRLPSTFLCPNCSDRYKDSQIDQIKLCGLPPATPENVTICTNCGHKVHAQLLVDKANKVKIALNRAEDLFEKNKLIEALPVVVDSIAKLQSLYCPPSEETAMAQIFLYQIFDLITEA